MNPFEGGENEEVAVLKYIDTWSRMTPTKQLEYASSLVGRVLVTDSKPGSICHAHFLAAVVADYVKKNSVVAELVRPSTPVRMGQIPHAKPTPLTQKVTGMWRNSVAKNKKQRQWFG